jgi:hypothetical protein
MIEADTVTSEELAILCDIVAGWSVKRAENLDADKQLALDRLIVNGFVEQANGCFVTKYQHTAISDMMKDIECVAIMLRLADDYVLADRADIRSNGGVPPPAKRDPTEPARA